MMGVNEDGIPQLVTPFQKFSYPLTLAFLQFAFMGVFFLVIHFTVNRAQLSDFKYVVLTSDKRWPALIVTHVFSTFFLQSLMLPAQTLSIGLFSASRATEIPVAAALRMQALGLRDGGKNLRAVGLAFVSACTMFYAYAEMSGCLCIWSGNGVALSGVAFWLVYMMLLAMPAANAVCQESIMLQPGMHPILLLAVQNILACLLFGPILLLCHVTGIEDVSAAFVMFLTYSEVVMLVLWLCAQMAASSALSITLIYMVDSFWTIALRSLRVALWAVGLLVSFYMAHKGVPVSVLCPRTSLWSFVLLCSFLLGAAAVYTDRVPVAEHDTEKSLQVLGRSLASASQA